MHVILAAHHVQNAAQDHAQNHAADQLAQLLASLAATKSHLLVCWKTFKLTLGVNISLLTPF